MNFDTFIVCTYRKNTGRFSNIQQNTNYLQEILCQFQYVSDLKIATYTRLHTSTPQQNKPNAAAYHFRLHSIALMWNAVPCERELYDNSTMYFAKPPDTTLVKQVKKNGRPVTDFLRNWNILLKHRRRNERDGVSNHRLLDGLLRRLLRRRSKKTSKLRVTGLCEGNSPVTGEFRSQRASNTENVSIFTSPWIHYNLSSYYATNRIPKVVCNIQNH